MNFSQKLKILSIVAISYMSSELLAKYSNHRLAPYEPVWSGVQKRVSNGPHLEITPHPLLLKREVVKPDDDYYLIFDAFSIARKEVEVNALKLHSSLPLTFQQPLSNYLWSYHSSPVAKGGVARRYNDEVMEKKIEWIDRYANYQENPSSQLVLRGQVTNLSPIEKYELLMGHTGFDLTQKAWEEGLEIFNVYKTVPGWIGACHGTAPATIKHEKPRHNLRVRSYREDIEIEFSPADIKMLLAHAWATYGGFSAMVGTRCYGGGISCFDTNPASFHITLMNLLGKFNKTLIVDASSREEVWNRPIVGYKIRFINPRTKIVARNFEQAMIAKKDFTNDRFRPLSSEKAKFIAGIWATVTYVDDVAPTESGEEVLKTSSYLYDLELDKDLNILGGEWESDYHPDFMWVVNDRIEPFAPQDAVAEDLLIDFRENSRISERVHDLSVSASKSGLMLFSIIKKLQQLSL